MLVDLGCKASKILLTLGLGQINLKIFKGLRFGGYGDNSNSASTMIKRQ